MPILTVDKNVVEKGVNDVAEAAFQSGYMQALKDVVKEKSNGKDILSIVSELTIKHMNEIRAEEFVCDHPFKFK